ncbi:MAG: 3-deoxy-7-phosphoheptulonate synthase [Candidatus Omnitrophica bacterium]|nr:3-deoxy-7-phosphoheptulonate synthase [Candidatus Omnitrophota bacterium]
MKQTYDIHVRSVDPLIPPKELAERLPMTEAANATVADAREIVQNILSGEDKRMLAIVGPCSIHDESMAYEYAERLKKVHDKMKDRVLLVMRVYFEKPRTIMGWKGLINDPHMDGTFDIETGLHLGRKILLRINEMGLPVATEMLEPITPQYIADLVAWASIGARTTESQTHRQMASGLSMPVGYKNATDGNLDIAIQAMTAAQHPHSFLGIDYNGQTCVINTNGNPFGHIILRGGRSGPNYDPASVQEASRLLERSGLNNSIMVDCSHANSNKDHRNQSGVCESVLQQRVNGNENLIGFMLESNLKEGNQPLPKDLSTLKYGVSVTDACLGWEQTEKLLDEVYQGLGT